MAERPDLVSLSDQEIVALAKEGREAAYRELIRRYERPVFSLILRMVRDRQLAEQTAFKEAVLENGMKVKVNLLCDVGDKVLIGKWSGTEVKIDGEEYLILKENEILGIVG